MTFVHELIPTFLHGAVQNAGHVDVYVVAIPIHAGDVCMPMVSCKPVVEARNTHDTGVC